MWFHFFGLYSKVKHCQTVGSHRPESIIKNNFTNTFTFFSALAVIYYVNYTHLLFCIVFNLNFVGITHGAADVKTVDDVIIGIISFMIGYIYFAFLFVMIFQMILSYGMSSTKYETIMNQVNEYMKHKQLPIEMQQRLVSFYQYKFQKRYFREVGIANALSGMYLEIRNGI